LQLLTPVLDCLRHEKIFISAVLHRSPEDPTSVLLHEVWADRDDLINVPMGRKHRSAYEARLPDRLRAPRRAEVWQRLRADAAVLAKHPSNLNLR
jgi:quinol monooxygenase YgiN